MISILEFRAQNLEVRSWVMHQRCLTSATRASAWGSQAAAADSRTTTIGSGRVAPPAVNGIATGGPQVAAETKG
jgi:hypothetical protein